MFGIGFTELLLISIVAILFLGPDKLPNALVEMAKFIKSVKKTIGEAKASLEEEIKVSDLKEEALAYKKQLSDATEELRGFKNISLEDLDDVSYDDEISETSAMKQMKDTQKATDSDTDTPKKEKESKENKELESSPKKVEAKNETVTFKNKKKSKKKDKKKGDD